MKKIEEYLDLVLQSLVDNGDSICIYEVENSEDYGKKKYFLSPAHTKLKSDLGLSNTEIKQLLEILKEKEYLTFEVVAGTLYSNVFLKVKVDNSIGNTVLDDSMKELIGQPDKIIITLKGKFFLSEGGYTGKHKKEETEKQLQKLAMWITAIGTGLGGLYLVYKALIWFCCNFF
jgi:hypothetical protein